MKQIRLFLMVIAIICAVTNLTGCLFREEGDVTYERVFKVSCETAYYGPFGEGGEYVESMLVSEDGGKTWSKFAFGQIESFEYVKGHEYTIRVKVTRLANPPADGSLYTYELIEIIADNFMIYTD